MTVKILSFLLLTLSLEASTQTWEFVSRVDLDQSVTAADVGSLGKVYFGTERGNVYSLLPDGTKDNDYSSSIFQPVTSLDASNSLRVFVFYKDVAQFEFLERFSAFPRRYNLGDFGVPSAESATLGSNNTIWLSNDRELVQVNPFDHSILFQFSIDRDNLQSLGRDQKKIEKMRYMLSDTSPKSVGFENQKKFKPESTYLKMENENGSIERLEWPLSNISFVLFSENYFHLVSGERVTVYKLKE